MYTNVGRVDAGIRWIAALGLFAVAVILNDSPAVALGSALAAIAIAGTALTKFCPLYRLLGIGTRSRTSISKRALMLLLALVPARAGLAQTHAEHKLVLRPESRLWLEGSSNLHDWSCDATEVSAEMIVRTNRDSSTQAETPTTVDRVTVSVPVQRIECANRQMNGNLRKTLRAKDHPVIEFSMTGGELGAPAEKGRLTVSARGDLTVAGTTLAIALEAEGRDTGDGALRITGAQEILMTDYGISPPTALMGLLKTDNRVLVRFDLIADYVELEAHLTMSERN